MLVGRQQQIEAKRHQQQQQLLGGDTDGRQSFDQALAGPEQDLQSREEDEASDAEGPDSLVLVMAVGMVTVRPRVRQPVGDQSGQAREGISGAVHRIGDDGQRTTDQPDSQLEQ